MSYHVYPVTESCETFDEYSVKVNGREIALNFCRVSKEPFNRRWPGHQRQSDQSELSAFVLMETDEPLEFEVTTKHAFETVRIRPRALGIQPHTEGNKITFRLERAEYFTVEPFGRHGALHIFCDPVGTFERNGNDIIYFGRGEHDVGTIELKSNQTLYIDEGAVVYACVNAVDAENIRIVGKGILDNSRNHEEILFEANAESNMVAVNNAKRAHTVQLEYCTNVLIDGITIRDSLVYNIRPIGCTNLTIRNVKIIGCWRFNSDGIDMHNCTNVQISHCFIRTFDDSVCVKGFDCYYDAEDLEAAVHDAMYRNGRSYDTFKNVVVKDCVIWNDWGRCLEIGAETRAEEICNVRFEDCKIIHVTHNVLDCTNVDYAWVHDIVYENIQIEYDDRLPTPLLQMNDAHRYSEADGDEAYAPLLIGCCVQYHPEYSAGGTRRGKNEHLTFKNIQLFGNQTIGIDISGMDEAHASEHIVIDGLYQNGQKIRSLREVNLTCNAFGKDVLLK